MPDACLADAALDVGDWATARSPGRAQRAALRARLVGEFDRPDAEALRALARFYVRTGFGAEARALLAGFPEVEGLDDRALIVDLAARRRRRRRRRRTARWRSPCPAPAATRSGWRSAASRRPSTTRPLRRRGGRLRRAAGRPARAPRAAADRPAARRRPPGRGAPPARRERAQRRRAGPGDAARRGADARRRRRDRARDRRACGLAAGRDPVALEALVRAVAPRARRRPAGARRPW